MSKLRGRLVAAGASGVVLLTALMIAPHEGEVRTTYQDPIGIDTACFGQTGKQVVRGKTYTGEQCAEMLIESVKVAIATVDRCAPVPMPDHAKQAFASFVFNVGPGGKGVKDGFCTLKNGNMPTIRRRLLAGDITGACRALNENGAWTTAGGKRLPGLVTRRADERRICEGRA